MSCLAACCSTQAQIEALNMLVAQSRLKKLHLLWVSSRNEVVVEVLTAGPLLIVTNVNYLRVGI